MLISPIKATFSNFQQNVFWTFSSPVLSVESFAPLLDILLQALRSGKSVLMNLEFHLFCIVLEFLNIVKVIAKLDYVPLNPGIPRIRKKFSNQNQRLSHSKLCKLLSYFLSLLWSRNNVYVAFRVAINEHFLSIASQHREKIRNQRDSPNY